MTRWRLGLAVAIVLGLAIWGLGLGGSRIPPTGLAASVPKLRTIRPTAPPATPPVPQPIGPPDFRATFTGPLDTSVWDTCYPWAAVPAGCTNFGNKENEWYLPSQVEVTDDALHLIAQPIQTEGTTETGQPELYDCRSGMVTSYPGFRFEYGYVSMVARVPNETGLWTGLWLAAANLEWPPEVDIMEWWGPPISAAGVFFHPVGANPDVGDLSAKQMTSLSSGWHKFGLLWTSHELVWYIDNKPVMKITANVPQQMMYIIATLANFADTGGCSGQLLIRSVDVWLNP
jgi:beta-glucanase (GH16 family)